MNADNDMQCQQENDHESNGPSQPEHRPRKSSITKFEIELLDELNEEHEKKKSAILMQNS